MNAEALFYPFHLCHSKTLELLLTRFHVVHFRDFMALQLTPFSGTTAFPDRMGDSHPELVKTGRMRQGYDVSGSLSPDVAAAIDHDLRDPAWRSLFHGALLRDVRFQRGIFPKDQVLSPSWNRLASVPYTVDRIRAMSGGAERMGNEADREYGLALVKTSASLVYTYRLALAHGLQTVTDSVAHYSLFEQSRTRDRISVGNHLLHRHGY